MYNKLVAELVMGRVGYGPSLHGPSWLWAEFVMGRVCYGPRCPVTHYHYIAISSLPLPLNTFWKCNHYHYFGNVIISMITYRYL